MNIQVRDLYFTYPGDVQALHGVNLTIPPGEIVAWVGENGAGKTTLAKLIKGLLKPSSGQVIIGDIDTQHASPASLAHVVGYVFQNPDEQLFLNTVWKEVAFGPSNLLTDPGEVKRRTQRALELVKMSDKSEMHPYDLLPSERKLLGLASILSMQTSIMILDEPTMGMDYYGIQIIAEVIQQAKQAHQTMILISHDMDFCLELTERFIVFTGGRIIEEGPPAAIFDDPILLADAGLDEPQLVRLAKALGYATIPINPGEFLNLHRERRKET